MNPINTILLQPADVLFFRDGRPMEGSLAGHGAAWPLPNMTDAAFHAALHRSGLSGHPHDQMRNGERTTKGARQFGSLVTAGPFPVHQIPNAATAWYFPRPLDLMDATLVPTLLPTDRFDSIQSSLTGPLKYAVASAQPPSKDSGAKAWLSADAYRRYINGGEVVLQEGETCDDSAFSDTEATIGIAIDADTGTAGQGDAVGKIYSARYLRLRDGWRLGAFAKTDEKNGSSDQRLDLIPSLISEQKQLLVGGQQRLCTATRCEVSSLPLPRGKTEGFTCHDAGGRKRWLVKWILLAPAIWPEISDKKPDGTPITDRNGKPIEFHPGGWLPNWVRWSDGKMMLRTGERQRRTYAGKHSRGFGADAQPIAAHLVAALVPKTIPVTGWALAVEAAPSEISNPPSEIRAAGAKSTHLAVPAGAVYYFEAGNETAAKALATALNWHGSDPFTIRNRRSTLMGEKGFGLGVCGTWSFHPGPTTTAP